MRFHDRVFTFYISSSFTMVKESRRLVIKAVRSLGQIPIADEYIGIEKPLENVEQSAVSMMKGYIEACDVFVLLLDKIDRPKNDRRQTIIQTEYKWAKENNKPIVAFVRENESFPISLEELRKRAFVVGTLIDIDDLFQKARTRHTIEEALDTALSTMMCDPDLNHLGWVRPNPQGSPSAQTTPNPARTGDFFDQLRELNSAMQSLSDEIRAINEPDRLDASVRATKAYLDSFSAFLAGHKEEVPDDVPNEIPQGLLHWLKRTNWSDFSSQARGWVETIIKALKDWPWS